VHRAHRRVAELARGTQVMQRRLAAARVRHDVARVEVENVDCVVAPGDVALGLELAPVVVHVDGRANALAYVSALRLHRRRRLCLHRRRLRLHRLRRHRPRGGRRDRTRPQLHFSRGRFGRGTFVTLYIDLGFEIGKACSRSSVR